MSICHNYLKIAYTVTGPKEALLTRLRCKQWTCEYCAGKNARAWQYWLIKRLPEVSDTWWFMTLTSPKDRRTTLSSLAALRLNIDRLIKRMKRVFGSDIEYVRVFEKHPTSQAMHAHFVICGLSPYVANGCSIKLKPMSIGVLSRSARSGIWSLKTWLKRICKEIGMGEIADVQPFNGPLEIVAFYVTKYLTKEQQSFHIPHLRHVQVSQGIGKPVFDDTYDWTPASYITSRTFDEPNTKITDLNTGFIIDNNYWEVCGYYPADD